MNDSQLAMYALAEHDASNRNRHYLDEAEKSQQEQLQWAREDRARAQKEREDQNSWWRKALGIGGTVLGGIGGAVLAPFTGGASIPMGAMLGAGLGGGLGREIGSIGLSGGGNGQYLTQGMMPMLSYMAGRSGPGAGAGNGYGGYANSAAWSSAGNDAEAFFRANGYYPNGF